MWALDFISGPQSNDVELFYGLISTQTISKQKKVHGWNHLTVCVSPNTFSKLKQMVVVLCLCLVIFQHEGCGWVALILNSWKFVDLWISMLSWSSRLSTYLKIGSSIHLIVIGVGKWETLLSAWSTTKVEKCFISADCLYEQLLTHLSSELATEYFFRPIIWLNSTSLLSFQPVQWNLKRNTHRHNQWGFYI